MVTTTAAPRVQMQGMSLTLGASKVLEDVSIELAAGEVHALVGQNGAGKSTLMKVLGGVHGGYSGEIHINGDVVRPTSPRDALKAGIGVIYQELSLVAELTVIDNILLGTGQAGFWSRNALRDQALIEELASRVPLLRTLPLDALVGDLSAGLQQRVEIVKALTRQAQVLVMDEPTARLSNPERVELAALIRELSEAGTTIIYISHFLDEIFDVAHSLTVLRNGRVVTSGRTADFTIRSLTQAMLNQELLSEEFATPTARQRTGAVAVEARGLRMADRVDDVSFSVEKGEIVGLAGLVGSGRTRVARLLVGADRSTGGTILLDGRKVRIKTPRAALKLGIAMLAEDRKTQGVLGNRSAGDNLVLMALDRALSRGGFIRAKSAKRRVAHEFDSLQIRPADPTLAGADFSGGNQQKFLLGRVLVTRPSVLIADQPTAGVDVGTKAQIHHLLREAASSGAAVLVISDDVDELLALSNRLLVMSGGRVVRELERTSIDRQDLIAAIGGD